MIRPEMIAPLAAVHAGGADLSALSKTASFDRHCEGLAKALTALEQAVGALEHILAAEEPPPFYGHADGEEARDAARIAALESELAKLRARSSPGAYPEALVKTLNPGPAAADWIAGQHRGRFGGN